MTARVSGALVLAALVAGPISILPARDQRGTSPLPLIVGRATQAGDVRLFADVTNVSAPVTDLTVYRNVFNEGFGLSSADVDGDGTRDAIAFYAPFGALPELRAYSGTTGALIAMDVADTQPSNNLLTASYVRPISASRAYPIVARGGTSPTLRILTPPASPDASPAILLPPTEFEGGAEFQTATVTGPSRVVAAVIPRGVAVNTVRVYNLGTGLQEASFAVTGSPMVLVTVDVAEVIATNPGPEIILASGDLGTPQVRVYSLGGTLLNTINLAPQTPFLVKGVGIPTGQGPLPSGAARIFGFQDGMTGVQAYSMDPTGSTFTNLSSGSLFLGRAGLTGALGPVGGDGEADLFVGSPFGFEASIQRANLDLSPVGGSFFAFDSTHSGGVRVATGDVNGDGIPDIVAASGPGTPPRVRVYNGAVPDQLLFQFTPYPLTFTGGVTVAAGDLDGDGIAEIVTGTAGGGVSLVRIFNNTGTTLNEFLAYDATYLNGVNVAVGDVAGDGAREIVVSPNGPGLATVGRIYGVDGVLITQFQFGAAAFDTAISLAVGDVTGDGKEDIITGFRNTATTTQVRVFQGSGLPSSGSLILSFAPFAPDTSPGANVAFVGNTPGSSGRPPRIVVGEAGTGGTVRVFDASGALLQTVNAFAAASTVGVNPATIRFGAAAAGPQHNWVVR